MVWLNICAPSMMILGGKPLGGELGHEVGALKNGISAHIETQEMWSLPTSCGDKKQEGISLQTST